MNVTSVYPLYFMFFMASTSAFASEQISTTPKPVLSLSNERIQGHRLVIRQGERARQAARLFGVFSALTFTGIAVARLLSREAPVKPASQEDLDKLAAKVEEKETVKKETKEEAVKIVPKQGWGTWVYGYGVGFAGWVKATTVLIAASMLRTHLMSEAGKVIWPIVPTFGRYLWIRPTMVWAMTQKSKFYDAITSLTNWTRVVLNEPDSSKAQHELVMCGNQFVIEMETILGYMGFILDKLVDEKEINPNLPLEFYRQRGMSCMQTIALDVERLVSTINHFASLGYEHQEKIRPMIEIMHKILFSIVCQMENFGSVVKEAGYIEELEKDVFDGLKSYVLPRWRSISLKPENYDDETEGLRELCMDVINHTIG